MKTALLVLGLIIGFITGSSLHSAQGAVDPAEAVRLAYKMGLEDSMYSNDDIGVERLSLKDLETLLQ